MGESRGWKVLGIMRSQKGAKPLFYSYFILPLEKGPCLKSRSGVPITSGRRISGWGVKVISSSLRPFAEFTLSEANVLQGDMKTSLLGQGPLKGDVDGAI